MTQQEWTKKYVRYQLKKEEAYWKNDKAMIKYYQNKLDDLDSQFDCTWTFEDETEF